MSPLHVVQVCQPRLGTKRVGSVDFVFDDDAVAVRIVEPPELSNHEIEEFEHLRP
jgi:hypothetical protein